MRTFIIAFIWTFLMGIFDLGLETRPGMSLASKWAALAPCSTRWVRVLRLFLHHHSHHHHHHNYNVHSSSPILPNQINHRQFTLLCLPPPYYYLWQPPYFHHQEHVQGRIKVAFNTSGPSRMCWKPQKGCRKATTGFSLSWDFPDFYHWNREQPKYKLESMKLKWIVCPRLFLSTKCENNGFLKIQKFLAPQVL